MSEVTEPRIVSCNIYNPRNALFKEFRNDRAKCTTVTCTLVSCPLRDVGTCSLIAVLGGDACPYGRIRTETGFTPRAGKFSGWISDRRKEYEGVPCLTWVVGKMALVGDYVFLPYAHIDMNEAVPFLAHGGGFLLGCRFLPQADWTPDNVCKMLDFRPRAMMGGEITSYQKEGVPKFLLHLRETDPEMWAALIAERPALDTAPDHVGRKALLKTLTHPIEWTTDGHKGRYCVTWRWDGQHVRTTSEHAYNATWGGMKLKQVVVEGIPEDDATLVVQDNAWVNDETVFVD